MCSRSLSDEVTDITYSNNKIVPVKDAGDHITDPVVKEIFDAAQEASSIQLWYDQYLPTSVALHIWMDFRKYLV